MDNNLNVSLKIRIKGDMQDSLNKIAVEQDVSISILLRVYINKLICEENFDFLEDYKLYEEVKAMETYLSDTHKKATFFMRYIKVICYMLVYNDSYTQVMWRLNTQLKRGFYCDEDREKIQRLRNVFHSRKSRDIFNHLGDNLDFELLRFKTKDGMSKKDVIYRRLSDMFDNAVQEGKHGHDYERY